MSSDLVQLEAELIGFSYRAEDGGFAVGRMRGPEAGDFVAVGMLGHVNEGQHLVLNGRWTTHRQFGRQLRVDAVLIEDPRTLRGLERYLGSGAIRGLGPEMARRLVARFGLQTLHIIDHEPQRLREVRGIGKKRARTILEHWAEDRAMREIHASLRGFGIGRALTRRIVTKYGDKTVGVVKQQPYRLCREIRGIGFRTADRIAQSMDFPLDSIERAEAAILHVLDEATNEGHCLLPQGELLDRVTRLQVPSAVAESRIDPLILGGILASPGSARSGPRRILYHSDLERLEAWVADWIAERVQMNDGDKDVDTLPVEKELGLTLDETQRRAIAQCFHKTITILTGGPGTGKTTIVRVLLELAHHRNERWLLAAPTGRAARRLSETTGGDGRTIHRLLEFNAHGGHFQRNVENPLVADAVLVDEASMIDLPLMASLIAAIPSGCRLVLVGDADQLPSVGPGKILADMVRCGTVPVSTLSKIYRQAGHSGIVRNAWRVNQGQQPISGERDEASSGSEPDFFILNRTDPLEAQATLLEVVLRRLPSLGFDPLRDVQVLTPMHNGPLGTDTLNRQLQRLLDAGPVAIERGEQRLRLGDRVLQTRNDYDQDIFNGDTGRIRAYTNDVLEVDFDGRTVTLDESATKHLRLAYAMSIHKSQGSEYPAVVVVLHRAHRIMLRRNLLYTAITRARRFCCLIGDPWAIERAVEIEGGSRRWTRLAERLTMS